LDVIISKLVVSLIGILFFGLNYIQLLPFLSATFLYEQMLEK